MISATGEGTQVFSDPTFWMNLGVAGVFLFMFATGRVHPQSAVDKTEQNAKEAIERQDRTIERLIAERDRALAERDEMIEVIKDFTTTASGLLQTIQPPPRPPPRRTER